MKVSPDGRDLIASFEQGPGGGPALVAYICPAGVPTIGYGHTMGVRMGDTLASKVSADILLDEDLAQWGRDVERLLAGAPTGQHEFDAMVSLAYNIGIGGFQGSTVLRRHRAGDKLGAANAFRLWNKATVGGQLVEMPGLTRRRVAEQALYLMPDAGAAARPMGLMMESPEDDAGMPQAVAAPRSAVSSRTLIAAGGAGITTLGAVADQVSQVASSASSVGYSLSSLVRVWGPMALGVIALGCIAYFGWRYFGKVRRGEVRVE